MWFFNSYCYFFDWGIDFVAIKLDVSSDTLTVIFLLQNQQRLV